MKIFKITHRNLHSGRTCNRWACPEFIEGFNRSFITSSVRRWLGCWLCKPNETLAIVCYFYFSYSIIIPFFIVKYISELSLSNPIILGSFSISTFLFQFYAERILDATVILYFLASSKIAIVYCLFFNQLKCKKWYTQSA